MTALLHSTAIPTPAATSAHPGSKGFNANLCPKCGEQCGDLIRGRHCLGCEVNWNDQFVGAEDVISYTCRSCDTEYPVIIAQDENGVWLTASDDLCPTCGYSGTWFDLQTEDPDTFWDADRRAV